jgi:hypothetical protein
MPRKTLIWVGLVVGSFAGGYAPLLWGADLFSFSSIVASAVGGFLGIWIGWRLGD